MKNTFHLARGIMMQKELNSLCNYFSKGEKILWVTSVILIVTSFLIFDRANYLVLTASLTGATSLIFNAKGNPAGQVLMVVFSLLYGAVSYTFAYYGEMVTYLGMTAPMSVFALVSWIKNPHNGNKSEVEIASINCRQSIFMVILSAVVTCVFYYILAFFNTANLLPSTVSVTTSFLAVYLTYKRSAFFAIAYASNDIILVVLWTLAAMSDISYLPVVTCFVVFFINDTYTFINWTRIYKRQKAV